MENWYVLYVKSRSEKSVAEQLRKMGFEALAPTQIRWRQWSDRKKKVEVVLFPNYVFVSSEAQRKSKVFRAGNVLKFVQFGGRIATLTEEEVDTVKVLSRMEAPVQIDYQRFAKGEAVEIQSGSLAGYRGQVLAVNGRKRIRLALPSLYCFAEVELSNVRISRLEAA
jgi:transcription antitermination factor NusG